MIELEIWRQVAHDQAHMAWGLFFPTAIAFVLAILVRLRGCGYTPVPAIDLMLSTSASLALSLAFFATDYDSGGAIRILPLLTLWLFRQDVRGYFQARKVGLEFKPKLDFASAYVITFGQMLTVDVLACHLSGLGVQWVGGAAEADGLLIGPAGCAAMAGCLQVVYLFARQEKAGHGDMAGLAHTINSK